MIVYILHSSIILCVSQAEESVAEEKMHSKERIPHHLSRHSQWTKLFFCFFSDYALNRLFVVTDTWTQHSLIHVVVVVVVTLFSSPPSLWQANRPPAKLNLLTCQVKHNPEEKRSFDLISRELYLPLSFLCVVSFYFVYATKTFPVLQVLLFKFLKRLHFFQLQFLLVIYYLNYFPIHQEKVYIFCAFCFLQYAL